MIIENKSLLESLEILEKNNKFDFIISISDPNSSGYIEDCNIRLEVKDRSFGPYAPTEDFIISAISKIKESNILTCDKLLISCHSGVSRSPAILLITLIEVFQYSPSDAVNLLFEINPYAKPNKKIIEIYSILSGFLDIPELISNKK